MTGRINVIGRKIQYRESKGRKYKKEEKREMDEWRGLKRKD